MQLHNRLYLLATMLVSILLSVLIATRMAQPAPGGTGLLLIGSSTFWLLMAVFLAGRCGVPAAVPTAWQTNRPLLLAVLALLPGVHYLLYGLAAGGWTATGFLKLVGFFMLPGLLFAGKSPRPQRLTWRDLTALALLWIPFDNRYLHGIWTDPAGLTYLYSSLLVVVQGAFIFGALRRLDGIGLHFQPAGRDWSTGAVMALLFLPIGLAIGLPTAFIRLHVRLDAPATMPIVFAGIFLTIAAPEELIFRGLLLNLLQKSMKSKYLALAISSVAFGFIHWNNGAFFDWRYILLASIAGGFYGLAYLRTGSLFAPMLTHTLVDFVWRYFLQR